MGGRGEEEGQYREGRGWMEGGRGEEEQHKEEEGFKLRKEG